jgi:hypothetical protein
MTAFFKAPIKMKAPALTLHSSARFLIASSKSSFSSKREKYIAPILAFNNSHSSPHLQPLGFGCFRTPSIVLLRVAE